MIAMEKQTPKRNLRGSVFLIKIGQNDYSDRLLASPSPPKSRSVMGRLRNAVEWVWELERACHVGAALEIVGLITDVADDLEPVLFNARTLLGLKFRDRHTLMFDRTHGQRSATVSRATKIGYCCTALGFVAASYEEDAHAARTGSPEKFERWLNDRGSSKQLPGPAAAGALEQAA